MPTLELTNKEATLLNELFATIADLDLNECLEDETVDYKDATFDSLWDKVVKL